MIEALVDLLVFVLSLLDVPPGQSVLNFSVRPRILLKHHDQNTALRKNSRYLGARSSGTDNRDDMERL
jgi:hypothetical protein